MLSEWAGKVQDIYSSVDLEHKEEWLYPSRHPFKKTEERYSHVSQLRQEGLHAAREMKAQYLLVSGSTFCWKDPRRVMFFLEYNNSLTVGIIFIITSYSRKWAVLSFMC